MKYAIGLDVGGTKIHTVIAEWDKNFLGARRLPKILKSRRIQIEGKKDWRRFFQEIIDEIKGSLEEVGEKKVERIGVGMAGPLSKDKVLLNPPNTPFRNFPILRKLTLHFQVPVYVDNDARCFTWGEHLFGAGRNASSTAGITIGTGIGGGIVFAFGGKPLLWDGEHGSAGEIGEMILDGSGSLGQGPMSFELLCSSRAHHFWKDGNALAVEQKARAGDTEAQEIYQRFGFWLGIGVANIVNVVNPEIVVVGGSIAKAWDLFEQDMNKAAETYIISSLAKKTKIVRAKLGDDAGALGAAYLLN